jgi:hypothetical protein
MGKKHWRKPTRDKNGRWRRGGWVNGSNPTEGCSFLALLILGLAAALTGRRTGRRQRSGRAGL